MMNIEARKALLAAMKVRLQGAGPHELVETNRAILVMLVDFVGEVAAPDYTLKEPDSYSTDAPRIEPEGRLTEGASSDGVRL